jgi:tRNA/rRNA methyltransferase
LLAKAEQYEGVAEAVADCKLVVGTTVAGPRRDLQHPLHSLDEGARVIKRQLKTAPVALLFGSERFGLSNQELSHCHWVMRIPTRQEHGSMNLGQAVAVCLYELVRGRKTTPATTARGRKEKTPAKSGEIERLTQQLFQILDTSGYVKPRAAAATEENLRRVLRRMKLDVNDTVLWLGILRQIAWKLRANEKDNE